MRACFARERGHEGRDLFRLELLEALDALLLLGRVGRNRVDHARPGKGRDRVRAHVEALHVEGDRFRKADYAELGRGVVRLPKIADEPGGRSHMDIGAGGLRLEVRRGGAAHIERPLEVDADDRVELLFRHLVEQAVAQIAGVVDDRVDPAERVDRRLNHRLRAVPARDAVAIGDRSAARRDNLVCDLLGDRRATRCPVQAHAEIVDDDGCARPREIEGDPAPHATPGAGDQRDLSVHNAHGLPQ